MSAVETWKHYGGSYEVSDQGRVRHTPSGRLRALSTGSHGYKQVVMFLNGKHRQRAVHRMVLETFVGPPPKGHIARHLNGDSSDNRVENLAWGTYAENAADTQRHGRWLYGERSPNAKLTLAQVLEIRASDETAASLARSLNVTRRTIYAVRTRRSWAWT